MTNKYKQQEHVYAVIRWDKDYSGTDPDLLITVKEIVRTQDLAEAEVVRLNALNKHKGVHYWWQTTRLYPEDSSAGTDLT
jgi:hypothetical protein